MEKVIEILNNIDSIGKIVLSKPMGDIVKANVRRVSIQGKEMWQVEYFINNQAKHKNIKIEDLTKLIEKYFPESFHQMNVMTTEGEYSVLCSKKGVINISKNTKNKIVIETQSHNKQKNYIIQEGMNVPFMQDLGIFTKENKIVKSMYDKFKQINKFVGILHHAFINYEKESITILDFGCGKSYLTFVVYYYFKVIRNKKVNVIGYDLKQDVVDYCNAMVKKYNYDNLKFYVNDVTKGDLYTDSVDMLITLHACDIATDYALKYAIENNVKYVFSVPCCQHEINGQITTGGDMDILLKDGLFKERLSALLTDAMRVDIMRDFGYNVDVMEFVDFSHSPKNIMLRCKLNKPKKSTKNSKLKDLQQKYNFEQTLYREMYKKL